MLKIEQRLKQGEQLLRSVPDSKSVSLPELLRLAEFSAIRKRIDSAIPFYEEAFNGQSEMSTSERISQRDRALSWFACRRLREGVADDRIHQQLAQFCVRMLKQQVDDLSPVPSAADREVQMPQTHRDILEDPRYEPLRELVNDERVSSDVRETLSQVLARL